MRHPEEAREYDLLERMNTLLYQETPPGIYSRALQALEEVQAARAGGDVRDAIAAITEYMQANPPSGNPAEWAEARRLNDEVLRREVDRLFGPEIYEEQNAYYAARDRGERVRPSDRLAGYWDFLRQFEQRNPLWGRYYRGREAVPERRAWGGRGRGWRPSRPTRPTWPLITEALGADMTRELVTYFRTGAQMSAETLQMLMGLMGEYGVPDWATWLALLRELFEGQAGAPLAEFRGRPQPVMRRYLRRQ